ncbi:SfnB family sulfur acquisition oxidoreductase [Hoyosella subflava]|uniref:Acyl-CoA dehydrogenase type 2 domain protein n=1 Tax=Hoyosella subflava (strain DSM 45089 / JCM 17490 / NBRC 109087 / DQS3-9A1) TaxID=443218 RepID=F6EHI5_HOYSD|nr:SfnB family sulfur acquisition oxidoreductase [Hoyosella subflava]AEF42349.1 Acyl-CoA dehydrogenase type 2 domain protein [Hoyosella subflava DQS3-9A1]
MSWDNALPLAAKLADSFRETAWERDRDRILPHAEVEQLSTAGVFALTVPREYGGPDAPASVLAEIIRLLASADPNIAQIPHSHFVYVNFLKAAATDRQKQYFFNQILDGARLANAQSERGGRTIASVATRLERSSTGYVLFGTKYYCTGTLFADWIPVLAVLDEAEYLAFVPTGSPGLSITDDWNGLGQRTTASGTVHLQGVPVDQAWVVPRAAALQASSGYGAFAQLLHAAIDAGVARNALDDAAEFVRAKSRPWFEAGVEEAREDPLTAYRFGEVAVDVAAAESLLATAGNAVDTVLAQPSADNAAEASLAVATAKAAADRASLSATNAVFELSGTRSADASLGLDRHWRNARTHTLHDPVRWKYHHIGRSLLGYAPPHHGVF